jgi:predicted nucleotidyltransferase
MTKLQINEPDKQILEQILDKYPYQFYAYGSRVKGNARKYSDLDLCYNYQENMPAHLAVEIQGELEESNLPFVVELVN